MPGIRSSLADRVAHALRYPFARLDRCFLFRDGGVHPLAGDRHGLRSGRTPVIACGSNASPERLREKFGCREEIPVESAWLEGHAVVYSAHFSRYGALPATLFPEAEARSAVAVTWLTPMQLERMHASEALGVNYEFRELAGGCGSLADGTRLQEAGTYISLHGALALQGEVIRLKAVPAAGSRLSAMSQREAQEHAKGVLGVDGWLEDFVAGNIADPDTRFLHTARLKSRHAVPSVLTD